jgi:hypothetical protein
MLAMGFGVKAGEWSDMKNSSKLAEEKTRAVHKALTDAHPTMLEASQKQPV